MILPKRLEEHYYWTNCGDPAEINAEIAKCREDPKRMWLDLKLLLELKEFLENEETKRAQGLKVAPDLSNS